MRKFLAITLLAGLGIGFTAADGEARRCRRHHRRCADSYQCVDHHHPYAVTITACSCKNAKGSFSAPDTALSACYIIDANGRRFDGTVSYPGPGFWTATFPGSPVAPCRMTVVGNAGSTMTMNCTGFTPDGKHHEG